MPNDALVEYLTSLKLYVLGPCKLPGRENEVVVKHNYGDSALNRIDGWRYITQAYGERMTIIRPR